MCGEKKNSPNEEQHQNVSAKTETSFTAAQIYFYIQMRLKRTDDNYETSMALALTATGATNALRTSYNVIVYRLERSAYGDRQQQVYYGSQAKPASSRTDTRYHTNDEQRTRDSQVAINVDIQWIFHGEFYFKFNYTLHRNHCRAQSSSSSSWARLWLPSYSRATESGECTPATSDRRQAAEGNEMKKTQQNYIIFSLLIIINCTKECDRLEKRQRRRRVLQPLLLLLWQSSQSIERRTTEWIGKENKVFYLFDFIFCASLSRSLSLVFCRDELSTICFSFSSCVHARCIVFVIETSLRLPYADRWSLVVRVDSISFFFLRKQSQKHT